MMERNREGTRLSRRRQQRYRESPEEDGAMGTQERLRERGSSKKDHRERSSRSKRTRGERMLQQQYASNREESSSESANDDVDDEEDDVRHLPPPSTAPSVQHNHNHLRKSFPMTAKAVRSLAGWKAADEMIGVPVPRRARSSSAKRPQEFSYSGSSGGGEPMHRQTSMSPARPSPSNPPISQSSSSASARKKMKPVTGIKHRPTKMSKPSAVTEDLEIEVAEVLFGLTRQFQSPEAEQETTHKTDPKEMNGLGNEAKSRVSSPVSIIHHSASLQSSVLPPPSLSSNTAPASAAAPRKKKHRPAVKMEDENPTSTSVCSLTKTEPEQYVKAEASSPLLNKNTVPTAVENGMEHAVVVSSIDVQHGSAKSESNPDPDLKFSTGASDGRAGTGIKEEAASHAKESTQMDLDVNLEETSERTKSAPAADSSQKVKFSIDLMAPPPGKSSLEMEGLSEHVSNQKAPVVPGIDISANFSISLGEATRAEEVKAGKMAKQEAGEVPGEGPNEELKPQDFHLKKKIEKDRTLDLQLDSDKQDNDSLGSSKPQGHKQQQKAAKVELKPEKAAQSAPLPLPMTVGGWPGSFPPFGYMGQVPSMQPVVMDKSSGSDKTPPKYLSAQFRPKRSATQCYIAHNIQYHQQISRMNPFWPAAAGAAPVQVENQYNLNVVPPSEPVILGNPSQAKTSGSMQDKSGPLVASHADPSSKDKTSAGNAFMETAQRKQLVLQQAPQPGPVTNMMFQHGPTFIFPFSQQQQAAAAAAAARNVVTKSPLGASNAALSSSSPSSALLGSTTSGHAASMSFNYPGMPPNEAQYMALLQNGAYPFPIPAHVGTPPQYRGGSAQAMPFFNGSFYSPHMLHPPQLQQQQQQQQQAPQQPSHSHNQQGHQNTSTSSGSSSSQRPPQQPQRSPGGAAAQMGSSHIVLGSKQQQQLPTKRETGSENSPSTSSSKASQAQKSISNYNLATAMYPQNFALVSSAAATAALGSGGGNHIEKPPPPPQHQSMKVDMTTSQAFAMSFASFGGATSTPLQGLDFASMAQNHAIFQSFPEASSHGYQITAAAGGVSPATQKKKPRHHISEDGKSAGDRMNSNASTNEEERKKMTTSKSPASAPQHSTFSRPENDPSVSDILNNVVDSSSRTLNLIQAPGSGGRVSSRPATAAPTNSSFATTVTPPSHLQQPLQQQMFKLQKQQRQFLLQQQQQQQLVNRTKTSTPTPSATIYSDHLPAGSAAMAKFPQSLSGFPQALVQGGGATPSLQWKTSIRGTTPAVAVSLSSSTAKNQPPQQQGRSMQQPFLPQGHQTQISFGPNSSKALTPTGQQQHAGGSSNPSLSHSSASKNAGGSPRSSSTKPGTSQATMLSLQQQQQPMKFSPSSSGLKSSPLSNSSSPSTPAPNANSKQHQQPQSHQQLQKQQPIPQTQFFFSNPYSPAQGYQSNGAAVSGYYHQKRQSEQQSPQQQAQRNPAPGSTGNLSLCPGQTLANTLPVSDPAKTATGSDMKGVAAAGLMQQHHAQFAAMAQAASGAPHTLMSAAAAAGTFPYMHTMPSVSVKSNEQKPATSNAPGL